MKLKFMALGLLASALFAAPLMVQAAGHHGDPCGTAVIYQDSDVDGQYSKWTNKNGGGYLYVAGGGYAYAGVRFDNISGYSATTPNTLSAVVNTNNAYDPYFEVFVNDAAYGPYYYDYYPLFSSSYVQSSKLNNGYTKYTLNGNGAGIPGTLNVAYLGDFVGTYESTSYGYAAYNLKVNGVAIQPNISAGTVADYNVLYWDY